MHKPIAVALAATALALTAVLRVAAAPQHEGTLSYERIGHGATTLLLIPGLGSGAEVWKDVVADLSDRYTIVTVTLDGFDGTASFAAQSRATASQLVTSPENVDWVTAMVDATKAFYAALYAGTPAVSFEIFGAARHFIMLDQKAPFERALVAFAPPA
jgi:pimeloyl-ACP methyl ester carboxylesterase